MINLNKPLLAYLTFPLTSDPKRNGSSVEKLAIEIMKRNPNITVVFAHKATQFSDKIGEYRSILGDIQIIKNCDLLIEGKPLNYNESSGSVWEYEIAKFFKKPTATSDFLLGLSSSPKTWKRQGRTEKLNKLLEGQE